MSALRLNNGLGKNVTREGACSPAESQIAVRRECVNWMTLSSFPTRLFRLNTDT